MKICKHPSLAAFLFLSMIILTGGCDREKPQSQAAVAETKVIPVQVETLARTDLEESFTLPASLEAWEDLIIAAELAGPVEKINFEEGDSVKADDVLLEIDPDTINSSLRRDRENVNVIERKLERYRQLEKDGLVSRQEVEDLVNNLAAAKASLQSTLIQLEKSTPTAPVSGIVDRIYVDRGEYVDIGMSLLRLVQVDRLKVIAAVPEKDVPFLAVGQKVEIVPAGIIGVDNSVIEGNIEHIAYAADDTTRTYRTKIAIDNSSGRLRPGMIVRARFVRRHLDDVIAIPLYALVDREGDKNVFVIKDGIAREVPVEIGSAVGNRIVIESGLDAGQQLVTKGHQLLIDGARVVVRSE